MAYTEKTSDGNYWVIPAHVDSDHEIKCPHCSSWESPSSSHSSDESHEGNYWTSLCCRKYYQIYRCDNCGTIAALKGRHGKTWRFCRDCKQKELTTDWYFDEYPSTTKQDVADYYDRKIEGIRQIMRERQEQYEIEEEEDARAHAADLAVIDDKIRALRDRMRELECESP